MALFLGHALLLLVASVVVATLSGKLHEYHNIWIEIILHRSSHALAVFLVDNSFYKRNQPKKIEIPRSLTSDINPRKRFCETYVIGSIQTPTCQNKCTDILKFRLFLERLW